MKTLKVLGNTCLIFLTVISVCISLAFGYYHFFVKDLVIGVNNIGNQNGIDIKKDEDLTEEEKNAYEDRYFLEVNYYSNHKENGIELQELKFNYFRTWTLTSDVYRSTGMQYVGHYEHTNVTVSNASERDNYVFPQFYYYDYTDGLNYDGYTGSQASLSSVLKRSTTFTIKIDGKAYEIQLDKSCTTGWWIFGSTHYFTWSELFESAMQSVSSCDARYGDYYITVNLSDYFSIFEYNEDGKFKADDVSDVIKNYAVMKVHYDENGAKNSSQSLFGSIQCNPSYDVEDKNIDTNYWQERMVYNLSAKDFSYRYSDVYSGYFASLSLDTKTMFEDMPRVKVNISLDLQSQYLQDNKINIVGFDYNGLENFEIDTLTITGETQTFYLLEKSLFDTNLQTLKYSNGITFDYGLNATNNEYKVVVLWNGIHM